MNNQPAVSPNVKTAIEISQIVLVSVFALIIVAFALFVIWKLWKVDFADLLKDPTTDKASLSRLQFLIFTFVIAISFVICVLGDGEAPPVFPYVPPTVLVLLGISGGTYAVSKGVDSSKETRLAAMDKAPQRTVRKQP